MRIQETDAILKESRHSRKRVQPRAGFFARAWRAILAMIGVR